MIATRNYVSPLPRKVSGVCLCAAAMTWCAPDIHFFIGNLAYNLVSCDNGLVLVILVCTH